MREFRLFVILLVGLVVVGVSAYYFGRSSANTVELVKTIDLTTKQVDSLKKTIKPIIKEVVVYKERTEKLKKEEKEIIYNEEECEEIVSNLKNQIANQDTIIVKQDSLVFIEKTIIQKQDTIIKLMDLPKKQKRFGISVQAGYGIAGKELQPYIGVGISYDIFRF